MMLRRSGVREIRAVLLALTIAGPARADESNAVAAEALFNEGRALLDRGRFEEACERFSRSEQLDPAVGTLLNLGECYERLNKVASAWGAYRQAAALAVTRNDERRAKLARRAASRIEGRLARLTIAVDGASSNISVTRNGVRIDPAAYGNALPVDPGPQVLTATAPDREPWQTTIELSAGESSTVQVPELQPVPGATPSTVPRSAPHPITAVTDHARSKVALGLEVGGAVVLGAGLVFGGLALSKWATISDACPSATCKSEADRDRLASDASTAQTFAKVSTIGVVAGSAVLASGIVLHLTTPKRRISIAPSLDRSAAGFVAALSL